MEKPKRIFVALPISEQLQEAILQWEKQYQFSNLRWLKGKNLHITLVPPWYEEDWRVASEKLQVSKWKPFQMDFHTVSFGPDSKTPRLIWAEGRSDNTINELRLALHQALNIQPEKRPFKLHLTLARFKPEDFKNFSIQNLRESVAWHDIATRFVLMQSHLSSAGAEYEILEEFHLA